MMRSFVRGCILTLGQTAWAAAVAFGAADGSDEAVFVEQVYSVGMARGDTGFYLAVRIGPAEGGEIETYRRLAAAALCLERPDDLPVQTEATPDAFFLERLGRARERLAHLAAERTPAHRNDVDFDGGYSRALEAELQEAMVPVLRREQVFASILAAYERDLGNPQSCMERLASYLSQDSEPVPEEDQWTRLVDVCNGPPGDLRRHIIFHPLAEGVAPEVRRAFLILSDVSGFTDCLQRLIERDPDLTRRVLALSGSTGYREFTAVRDEVQRRWAEAGLPQALDEIRGGGDPALVGKRFLDSCPAPPSHDSD